MCVYQPPAINRNGLPVTALRKLRRETLVFPFFGCYTENRDFVYNNRPAEDRIWKDSFGGQSASKGKGNKMRCAYCGCLESKVVDSRQTEDGMRIRRRRECLNCGARFTTYEEMETIPLMVIKRDKSREPFDRQKLLNRLLRACAKRPVSIETLEQLVSDVEAYYANQMVKEVTSAAIGELVMERLKEIDQVAYVRFASVYKQFSDIDSFLEELKHLKATESQNM